MKEVAKKSTANQRCDFLLMVNLTVTVAALLMVCEIFSCAEVENRHSHPLYSDCNLDPSGGMTSNINIIYASLKSTFSGLEFCR